MIFYLISCRQQSGSDSNVRTEDISQVTQTLQVAITNPTAFSTPITPNTLAPTISATQTPSIISPSLLTITQSSDPVSSIPTSTSAPGRIPVATPVVMGEVAIMTLTAVPQIVVSSTQEIAETTIISDTDIISSANIHYVFPVQPPEETTYYSEHHDYPATDIFAPYRSEFVAVTDGVIDEVSRNDSWDPATNDPALRGGKYVSLIGDDGIRYYGSHLDEVAPGIEAGIRVAAGTLLGYVGNSGNARGLPSHLHFGISPPTFPGDWEVRRGVVSPYTYLREIIRKNVQENRKELMLR